jgi:hypothetical protein
VSERTEGEVMGGGMNSDEEVRNSYSSPKQYLDGPFKENVGAGTCNTRGEDVKCTQNLGR